MAKANELTNNSLSEQQIYQRIGTEYEIYPYGTDSLYAPAVVYFILSQDQYVQKSDITVADFGSNQGLMAEELNRGLNGKKKLYYYGFDFVGQAVAAGNKRLAKNAQLNGSAHLIEADITQLSESDQSIIKLADLIMASYVGPSIGLSRVIEIIDENVSAHQSAVIIDRAYTWDQAEGYSLSEGTTFLYEYIQAFQQVGIPVPWKSLASFFGQSIKKMFFRQNQVIYDDVHYQQGLTTHQQNAPGDMHTVETMIHDYYGERLQLFLKFADIFIAMINGSK